jgi:predicted hydrocarbon binding protein
VEEETVSQELPGKSGYYYPNLMVRVYLEAIRDVVGADSLKALLTLANMQHLVDTLPPDDLRKEFDFTDFSRLNECMEQLYGRRGGRALALRAGRQAFDQGLKNFGPMAGIADQTFRLLPLSTKLKVGLRAMATAFATCSDQVCYVREEPDQFVYVIERCPVCWGRHTEAPVCYSAMGIIQQGLSWGSGGKKFKLSEVACIAMGDPSCDFVIGKEPVE